MFSKKRPVFEPFKSKTYIKCAGARIKMLMGKKNNESKVAAPASPPLRRGASPDPGHTWIIPFY